MRTLGGLLTACALLSGCASADMPSMQVPGMGARSAPRPVESFAYEPASDRDIRVTVGQAVMHGDPAFIPGDPNWVQLRVTIANQGRDTVSLNQVKIRLADGTVVPSASALADLMKPPSYVREGVTQLGLGTAGAVAGAFLFPPLALVGGAVMAFGPLMRADRTSRMLERAQQEGLAIGSIAPETSVSGYIWAPGVTGQTGLVVFYSVSGTERSLIVPRTLNAPLSGSTSQ